MWGTANCKRQYFESLLQHIDFSDGRGEQVWQKVQNHLQEEYDFIAEDYLDRVAGGILVDLPAECGGKRG